MTVTMSDIGYERHLGRYGDGKGPTVIAVGGIHGNEPAGVHAITHVLSTLKERRAPFQGRFFGLSGNLKALRLGVRYINTDLNRLWQPDILAGHNGQDLAEYEELCDIRSNLESIIRSVDGPVTLLDLHSFSGDGPPFVISDEVDDFQEILRGLPFPVILDLSEKIAGTMNHYMGSIGHRAMAIEGGQHNDPYTVTNLTLFLWLFLLKRGYITDEFAPSEWIDREWNRLISRTGHLPRRIRVNYRHEIQEGDMFKMFPGFQSFSPISQGEPLATDRHGIIRAPSSGCILMPLYQGQGNDGFFVGVSEPH